MKIERNNSSSVRGGNSGLLGVFAAIGAAGLLAVQGASAGSVRQAPGFEVDIVTPIVIDRLPEPGPRHPRTVDVAPASSLADGPFNLSGAMMTLDLANTMPASGAMTGEAMAQFIGDWYMNFYEPR